MSKLVYRGYVTSWRRPKDERWDWDFNAPVEHVFKHPWKPVFAWMPVEINGKYKWLTKVWRRQIEVYGDQKNQPPRYRYGTLFDVIRGEE
jgi:hypothetical protein